MATLFISYARVDEQFALSLARDLRSAGVAVWLDQLDILPSHRWERAIEEAMESCPRFLIVLSPNSVTSHNVLAEINFALDEGKVVIPVLYQTCKVPYRLRLFQQADFTRDYKQGMERLQRVLRDEELQVEHPAPAAAAIPASEPRRSPTSPLQSVALRATLEQEAERHSSFSEPRSGQEREDVLRKLLDRPEWKSKIHLKPNIPNAMLSNACRSLGVGDGDKIVGLIDTTVYGSAKEAVLFSVEGLHFLSNGVPITLSYAHLRAVSSMSVGEAQFFSRYVTTVLVQSSSRSLVIGIAGGPFRGKELIEILSEMKKIDW